MQTVREKKHIIITVEGGLIQNIDNIPKDIEVIVVDFDTDGTSPEEDERVKEVNPGQFAFVRTWYPDIFEPIELEHLKKIIRLAHE